MTQQGMPSSCHTASSYLAPSSSSCLSCQTFTPCASSMPYPTSVLWCSLPLPLACQYTMVRDSFQDNIFIGSSVPAWHKRLVFLCLEHLPYESMYGAQQQSHKYVQYTAAVTASCRVRAVILTQQVCVLTAARKLAICTAPPASHQML